jgi:hypothetical protein
MPQITIRKHHLTRRKGGLYITKRRLRKGPLSGKNGGPMGDKRKHPRYACKIRADYEYYEGDPDSMDISTITPLKAKGFILDISRGGVFIVSDERVSIGMPIRVLFHTRKEQFNVMGKIVRTGLLKNNPSEVAQKFSKFSGKGDSYIAVEFDETIAEISEKDI